MQKHNIRNYFPSDPSLYIIAVWIVGLCLGIWVGQDVSYLLSSYLYLACFRVGSPIAIMAVLPLVLVFLAVWRKSSGLVFPILFLKAFADGIVLIAVAQAFGSASWLLGPLLLFSDRVSTFILIWSCAKCLDGSFISHRKWFFLCITTVISVSLIDYLFISPNLIAFVS